MHALFANVFDYAGLFPPAQLTMAKAVDDYIRVLDEDQGELVDRFLVPANKIIELVDVLRRLEIDEGFPISVIASPFQPGSLEQDWETAQDPRLSVEGFELRMPTGPVTPQALKIIRTSKPYMVLGDEFYIEFPLDENCSDNLHEASAVLEATGFKARTGGLTAEDFPSAQDLAQWIVDTTGLAATVKFTAGLHEAIRHQDKALDVSRHGFANVLVAFVGAEVLDLSTREVEQILSFEHASDFKWVGDGIGLPQGVIDEVALDEAMGRFGGIGSCSIDDPYKSLKKLGWW